MRSTWQRAPPEEAAREIERRSTVRWARLRSLAPRAHFPLRLTHARQYCKDRFALVGDAAHSIHPLAGQGVNLGFLDCAALVQVLAQEIANGGDSEALAELRVLRRYERWRKSENLIALGLVDGLNHLFSNPDGRWAGSAAPDWAPWKAARSPNGSSWDGRWAPRRGELPKDR